MLLLGLDFETLGLNPELHRIWEVGAVLWDTDFHRAVQSMGYLVQIPVDAPFEQEAVDATHFNAELTTKYGKESERALKQLLNMYDDADYIVAHNGNQCDRPFLKAWMNMHGLTEVFPEDKFWIDTLTDIENFDKKWNRQLTCLAAYHGFINPFPHQAVSDVQTMLQILDKYDIDEVITYAKAPVVGAKLTLPFESKDWAKSHGYFPYYHNNKFQYWMKKIKEFKFEADAQEAKAAGFLLTKLLQIPEGVY